MTSSLWVDVSPMHNRIFSEYTLPHLIEDNSAALHSVHARIQ